MVLIYYYPYVIDDLHNIQLYINHSGKMISMCYLENSPSVVGIIAYDMSCIISNENMNMHPISAENEKLWYVTYIEDAFHAYIINIMPNIHCLYVGKSVACNHLILLKNLLSIWTNM